jgi:hypothetical protein
VEAVYSKEKSFVEHLLPWQLQSKQYNFTVIFNNGLYSSFTFKDLYFQIIFSRVKLTSVKITENILLVLYSAQRKALSKISLGCVLYYSDISLFEITGYEFGFLEPLIAKAWRILRFQMAEMSSMFGEWL